MRLVSYDIAAIFFFAYPAIGLFQAGILIAAHSPSIPATTVVQQPSHLATGACIRVLPYHSIVTVLVPIKVNFSVTTAVRIPIIAIFNISTTIFRNRIISSLCSEPSPEKAVADRTGIRAGNACRLTGNRKFGVHIAPAVRNFTAILICDHTKAVCIQCVANGGTATLDRTRIIH